MKQDVIKILEQNAKEGWNGDTEAVGYTDFNSVAEQLVKLFAIPVVICSADDIKDKISESLNYYNVDNEDLDEMLEDVDKNEMSDIMDAITTLNTLLFKCET